MNTQVLKVQFLKDNMALEQSKSGIKGIMKQNFGMTTKLKLRLTVNGLKDDMFWCG